MRKSPEKILVSNSDINTICNEFIQKNIVEKWFVFMLGVILPSWLSFFTLLNATWTTFNTVFTTILVILTWVTVILGFITRKNAKRFSIEKQIEEKADRDSDYTALFIIARIKINSDGKKIIQVLVQEKKTWNCDFLPYWEINKTIPLEEQKATFCNGLSGKLNIQSKDIKIRHLEDERCYSIKIAVPEQVEKLFQYEFYTVTISSYLEHDLLNRYKWMDIDSLAEDANTVRVNGDVVDNLIRIKSRIIDSFTSYDLSDNTIKIIWNITDKCSFNCKICATHCEQKKELAENEKAKVLLSLMSMRNTIRELNFAGGDPLVSEESKKIIKYAMEVIDKNKISVTTTGRGIEQLNEAEKIVFLNNCVVSLDTFDFNSEGVRNSVDYNKMNARNSMRFRKYMSKLRVNVPIVDTNMEVSDIQNLVIQINKINPDEVSLIRLMPVGRQSVDNYPANYSAEKFIHIFEQNLNSTIQLHIHCSLRCQYCINEDKCTMLTQKIGIDCEGNVFACCWAGYLNCTLADNPFYIGNLLEHDLDEILKGNRALELLDGCDREKCGIFSFNNIEF